ncbi:CLIP domain-containing serine protease B9 [Drosophila virilis]|uniref:Peptidase S1 domain-containing protein n=1 Tax=Drosophila virilis TaxID=7244 RepID=B4LWL2_DROVI|nr:phenoloxidase-activating factor 3 [Drosophila virilis]EDW67677.1 uncharacterized protein Dvir_GJ24280 [Drosophila virilis]
MDAAKHVGNMKILGKLVVVLVGTLLSATASAELNCGNLEERLLFSKDKSTQPAEYPWMGVLFQRKGQSFENAGCNVVIVGESHVLTTASCVRDHYDHPEMIAVRLGIWNEKDEPDEKLVCNERGFCVPGPVQQPVAAITMHPQADKVTGDIDLAILRLSDRIKMTAHVQPLCLQPISEPASWINRYFHYGGFENSNYRKGKGLAMAISKNRCSRLSGKSSPSQNQFCAFPVERTVFYRGSAFMGMNIEKDVPRSFYLVGLLVKVVSEGGPTVFFIQDIKPWRRWIMENTR